MSKSYLEFLDNGVRLTKRSYLGKLSMGGSIEDIKKYKNEQIMREIGEDLIIELLKENKDFLIRTTSTGWYEIEHMGREMEEVQIDVHLFPLDKDSKRRFIESFETELNDEKPLEEFDFDGSMNVGNTVRFLNMIFEQNITQLPADEDIKFARKIICSDGVVRTNFSNGVLYYQSEKDY